MRTAWTLFVFALTALIGITGCGGGGDGGWSPFLSSDGTGVRGLDTPDQILANPYVKDALDEARDNGVTLTPEKGIDPPVISGVYDLAGEACCNFQGRWGTLAPGTWRWYNQTSANLIDTEYDQIGMQTGSGGGEIIRGTGNQFTVYSVLNISDGEIGGCEERAVAIIDGQQDDQGYISAVYIITPSQKPVCHAVTVGRLELTLTRSSRASFETGDGSFLIRILKDALENQAQQDDISK